MDPDARFPKNNPAGTAVLQSACAGVANPPVAGSELTLTDPITNCIISRALEFLTAMEFGHEIRLTPTSEGTRQTSYGFHHAPGTGTNLDQTIINKLDKTASPNTFNSFYIPLFYGGADQTNFKLND